MDWYLQLLAIVLVVAIMAGSLYLVCLGVRLSVLDFAEKLAEELRRQRSAQLRQERKCREDNR